MPHPKPTLSARRPGPKWSLALLAFGSLVTSLDFTIIFVALPEIAEVGFSAQSLQWVISAYAIFWGGFLLLGGRSADLLGRRRMFVLGMAMYGSASLIGGLADSPGVLIAARALQGVGAAVVFPAVLSLVTNMFAEGPERNRALAIWASTGAAGLGAGALLGGVLTQWSGWEAVFFVNLPLVAIAGVAAFVVLPPDAARMQTHGFDLPGGFTGTAGVTALVFAIAQGPELGWTSTAVIAAAGIAVFALGAFVAIERRSANPLLPLRLFARGGVGMGTLVIFTFGATWQVISLFLTLHFQDVLGFTALEGGLAFFSFTVAIASGNAISERLVAARGTRATLIAGFVVAALGSAVLATGMTADGTYLSALPGVLIAGMGGGLIYPAMFVAATTGVVGREQGVASGIASTALQVGFGAGLAVLASVATAGLEGLAGEALRISTSEGLQTATYAAAAASLLGILAAMRLPSGDQATVERADEGIDPGPAAAEAVAGG